MHAEAERTPVTPETTTLLLIGLDDALADELASEGATSVLRAGTLAESPEGAADADAVVLALAGAPLETLGAVRSIAPAAAVVVVTEPGHETDGTVALHAGAEDHLVAGSIPAGLLPRAVRYAIAQRRLQRDLATVDPATGLPNLRGFAPVAEHHLRMADRAGTPVVFLFVRLDGYAHVLAARGPEDAEELARDASEVVLEAVRDADLPARLAPDTFAVLLSGSAAGAETLVLSRLVEAIAVHDARRDPPRELSLSVGSAIYDPAHPDSLAEILETAGRRLADQASGTG
jgi:diguanylate cyclase (GGDEF)-like protein